MYTLILLGAGTWNSGLLPVNREPKMEHLPISYYRIGQPIQVDEIDQQRSVILELNRHYIAYQFGQERDRMYYSRTVTPEFVKPILRPLREIRMSHVIGLYRIVFPDSTKQDGDILEHVAELQVSEPNLIEIWADSTEPCLWLMSLNYDVQGLIKKGLAVADEA